MLAVQRDRQHGAAAVGERDRGRATDGGHLVGVLGAVGCGKGVGAEIDASACSTGGPGDLGYRQNAQLQGFVGSFGGQRHVVDEAAQAWSQEAGGLSEETAQHLNGVLAAASGGGVAASGAVVVIAVVLLGWRT